MHTNRRRYPLRDSLVWRLVGIYVVGIGLAIVVVWLAIETLAADYFMFLMREYNVPPDEVQAMFIASVRRYMAYVSGAAIVSSWLFGWFLTHRMLEPLWQMATVAEEIAAGDYAVRVQVAGKGEIARLGAAFNQMAAGLARVERARQTTVVDVAHELRSPLTNIRGYLEALSDGVVPPSRETFESLEEETLRLVRLVDDVMRLARAEAAGVTLRPTDLDCRDLVEYWLDRYRERFAAKAIRVEKPIAGRGITISADGDKVGQAIQNILDNVVEYTPRGGRLLVSLEREPGAARVVFTNTVREPIATNHLSRIFDRFYRVDRSPEHAGAGVGLAIVAELIKAHGGEVGAESHDGELSIWFRLPA